LTRVSLLNQEFWTPDHKKLIREALAWLGQSVLIERGTKIDAFCALATKLAMVNEPRSKQVFAFRDFDKDVVGFEPIKVHVLDVLLGDIFNNYVPAATRERANLNMAFLGEPGTGKSVTARKVGQFYQAAGILKPVGGGKEVVVVEVSRSDLVGNHWGAGIKNLKVHLGKSKGGVLLIDEAHSIVLGESDMRGYGGEILEYLVKVAEDERDERIIMLTGYPQKMKEFFDRNPGLGSRFPAQFHCPNFSTNQLAQIFRNMLKERRLTMLTDADGVLQERCERIADGTGNGRAVRNLLEAVVTAQRRRLSRYNLHLLKKNGSAALKEVKAEDFGTE
jgi:SpoVK/Ycf46/Vps4 family AAA+-type ATPase